MTRGSKNPIPSQRRTDSTDPQDLNRRIFVGNLPTNKMTNRDMEELFSKYGKISALSLFRGFGFVQFESEEEAQAAVEGEKGRLYKGYRLDINKATERRNMNKAAARPSPPRRDSYAYGDGRDVKRDRSPIRGSPKRDARDSRDGRDSRGVRDARDVHDPRDVKDPRDVRDPRDLRDPRELRDSRDLRDPRELRDPRDLRDPRELRDPRDPRELRDPRDPLYDRYRDVRDSRDPLYRRDELYDRYYRYDDYRKKDDLYVDRYRDERNPRDAEERLKREERRREELYRQYFEEIQRRFDSERPVDCSVVVVTKQAKDYAESVGRKVRDIGMVVDLIFLNSEVSLNQALEDVGRGGTPFAIVVTQQHQVHHSCTVNIMFGTPQEHRNMPLADAVLLVARNYERYKTEVRDKDREAIARKAAKMADDTILQERERATLEEASRSGHPPGIQTLLNLLADNRYLTAEETDKIIDYLREKKERQLRGVSDPMQAPLSRQPIGASSVPTLDSQSSLQSTQPMQSTQPLSSGSSVSQSSNNPQQELQAKILSLFNSGAGAAAVAAAAANSGSGVPSAVPNAPNQSYGAAASSQVRGVPMNVSGLNQPQQRSQAPGSQHSNLMGSGASVRSTGPRPGVPSQSQVLFGQHQNRMPAPNNVSVPRPAGSGGINFDNPSVQKALDTLIQSGPALSHLVNQTTAQSGRVGPPGPQAPMGSYQRHF